MRIKVSAPADPGSIQQQSACTLDVAGRGARISGVKFSGKIGDTVVVERGNIRAGFKVAWIGQAGTSRDGQLGLQATERVLGLWGIETAPPDDFRGIEPDGLVPSLAAVAALSSSKPNGSNRALMRYTCGGDVEFRKDAQFTLPLKGKLRDIGGRGCFVMTKENFPLNTRMVVALKIGLLELQVRAQVKTAEKLGMWMEWVDLPEAERDQINELVDRLAV
jgi:PilZ domain-containing protein